MYRKMEIMPDNLAISQAVAPIYFEPSFTSQMVTQGLLWENLTIMDSRQRWFQIQLEDGYIGWIHEFYTRAVENADLNTIKITSRFASVREKRGIESIMKNVLSFGTRVPKKALTLGYTYITFPNGEDGFILTQTPAAKFSRDTLIQISNTLIGVPYLWGDK